MITRKGDAESRGLAPRPSLWARENTRFGEQTLPTVAYAWRDFESVVTRLTPFE